MKCPRCSNEDSKYFYEGSSGYYCRRCIKFKRILFDNKPELEQIKQDVDSEYELSFELSDKQKELSKMLSKYSCENDVLVYAGCGCGKTEIIYETVAKNLAQNKIVAIAIPRRQVVLELQKRFQSVFRNLTVIGVCEGYTEITDGDLIICTTHQLYRYLNKFDLLIIDEPDAFPFHNNEILENIARNSCKGNIVYLSATPSKTIRKHKTLYLFERPHKRPHYIPKVTVSFTFINLFKMYLWCRKKEKVLIFVPTINIANILSRMTRIPNITSKSEDKELIIERFKTGKIKYLFCTTILERGVTFEKVNICIFDCAKYLHFTTNTLIQILGRVQRSFIHSEGEAIILSNRKSKEVDNCIKEISMMNAYSALTPKELIQALEK